MVARAERQEAGGITDALAPLFGLEGIDLPVAPFARLGDYGTPDDGWWMRADPVHLAPDRDQLVLMPESMLHVTPEEARALMEAFDEAFASDDLHLEFPMPARGYLRCPAPFDVTTYDPAPFVGGSVFEGMPVGADAPRLKLFMNEIQMLFHAHHVNSAREEAGQPTINALWLWGGGSMPAFTGIAPTEVITDLPLVRGLALWAGQEPVVPNRNIIWRPGNLFAFPARDVKTLERDWFDILLRELVYGDVLELHMHLGGLGSYVLDRRCAQRFWRRGHPLVAS